MNKQPIPPASKRPVYEQENPPSTWSGLALYVVFVALFPVTLYALAYPMVVAAAIAGVAAGLLARPLYQHLTRRTTQPRQHERPSTTVKSTVTRD